MAFYEGPRLLLRTPLLVLLKTASEATDGPRGQVRAEKIPIISGVCTGEGVTVLLYQEPVPKTIPQTVESVPNVESAQEYETQFIDRYNYPSVSKTENCQN